MVNRLVLKGTNYEIGFKHGTLARSQIHACLTNYATYFANAGMSPGDVKSLATKFSETIKLLVPHLHDELRGIADGACVPLLDIVALNSRSEIALAAKPKNGKSDESSSDDDDNIPVPPDGCTTFAETVDGRQWLAQNWDWQTSQLCNLVLLEITTPLDSPSNARMLKTMTEAGLLAKVGFNSEKVGVCLNALRATDLDTNKLPLHVLLRLVLESSSVADAKERFTTKYGDGAACFGHFGIADGKGEGHAESWEIGPYGIAVIPRDAEGRLYHTNHALVEGVKINEVIWLEDTKERLMRLKELVFASDKKTDVKTLAVGPQKDRIFSFLKDEDNFPNSICRANDDSQPGLLGEMQTVFSIVMDLKEDVAWVAVGRPKQVLEEFTLEFF
ncbi:putative acyl-CoA:6-aminopenicillanic-acid-acyltransferase [Myxozyma melibiosi]|uniref:Acyl-CoA:6-aminopenicillanic-acid-acyltransferase n=1 Tax=Myxozyma melibiosi TaxID=54550 RepID=A0ABR1F2H6_9ASCO